MDFNKLSMGMKLALVGGALSLIAIFLPWYGFLGFNISAFNSGFFAWFGCILGVAGAAVLLMKSMGKNEVKAGGFATEQVAAIAGALGFLFVVLRFVTQTDLVKMGLFVGLIGTGLVAYGAFTTMKAAGMDFKPKSTPTA